MSQLPKIYVDGHAGTTGLRIREWLSKRSDIELLTLREAQRKDPSARRDSVQSADITVLCLPNEAAVEAAAWVDKGGRGRLIDASSAHRVADGWVFGLPELEAGQRDAIKSAGKVSNPGCYSSSSILLLRPLIDAGVLSQDAAISIHALSGYSGGGRRLIEKWEDANSVLSQLPYQAPYSLTARHKHIPEMTKFAHLNHAPQFVPAVGSFRCGMRVEIPLHQQMLHHNENANSVNEVLAARYKDEHFVSVISPSDNSGINETSLNPGACNDTNRIELRAIAHPDGHVLLVAVLDNLGKGASGMAIQNLNLMLGLPEHIGLPN